MLAAIIEDRNNNIWSQLFINNDRGKISLDGFSIIGNVISQFKKEYLNVFNFFVLSNNCEKIGEIDGYDVILDNRSGFYHFFKDSKEDFNKFLIYNSTDASFYDNGNKKDSK